jgi:hypothetical protein
MEKKTIKAYTRNELEFVWFKAKVLMFASFVSGMLATAVIYWILNTMMI